MKACTKCNTQQELSEFSKQSKAPDGLAYWCKRCYSEQKINLYNANIDQSRENTNNRRKERTTWFRQLKLNNPCKDCGIIYSSYCMDYDHLSDKIKSVTRMVLDNTPKHKILEEIKKCELVCVLCHNTRTKNRLDEKYKEKKYSKGALRNIEIINTAKNKPCMYCSILYEPHNMQLDHIDHETKYKDVCDLKNFKEETLRVEISKCQVVCALCHRIKSIIEKDDDLVKNKISNRVIDPPKEKYINFDLKEKECMRCTKILKFDCFQAHKKTRDGLNSWCKECFNIYRKENRRKKKM